MAQDDTARALSWLRSPEAVRARCAQVLAAAGQDGLRWFRLHEARLNDCAAYVAATIRRNYPSLAIPHHARWRHFASGGVDRWARMAAGLRDVDADEVARIRFDLCTVSVLLDAGAGAAWRYREAATGQELGRSEGLAVASLDAFAAGLFSGDPARPLRADAAGLASLDGGALAAAFQSAPGREVTGMAGRAALLRRLGGALRARPDLFGAEARIGKLFDALLARRGTDGLKAREILGAVLDGIGPAWPSRLQVGGVSLGDVWPHPAASGGVAPGLVPFHKLSQWLTYSLIEVFEDRGIPVTGIGDLTGLPEYRNGGLFLDTGVLELRVPSLARDVLPVGHEAVVEWRALTVALLDRIAVPLRARLGVDAAAMPLSRLLEGGTWAAGRRVARETREGGVPPLQVESDGTVF